MQRNGQEELFRGPLSEEHMGQRWMISASASPPSASCPLQCYVRIGVPAHTVDRAQEFLTHFQ